MVRSSVLALDERGQILACTVDSSKRLPADFTIVDFVQTRPSVFVADPRRLRTAATHARYATMLIMSPGLYTNPNHNARLLKRLYDDATSRGGAVTKYIPHENPNQKEGIQQNSTEWAGLGW